MTRAVLDASALLAVLNAEPGADVVRSALPGAVISAVNYSEVLKKTIERGIPTEPVLALVHGLPIDVIAFDETLAALAASLYTQTKARGMSFADRACLALGIHLRVPVLTAERKMGLLHLPIKVQVIRNASG